MRPARILDPAWRLGLIIAYQLLRFYWRLFRPPLLGVSILLWSGGKLLCVRHSYRPGLAVPAGSPGRGESHEAAALREFLEEVGVLLPPGSLRGPESIDTLHEGTTSRIVFFEARLDEPPPIRIDRREIVWAGFVDPAEVPSSELWLPLRRLLEKRSTRT